MRINSFVTPDQLKADTLVLSSEESHHLARVLRVEPGQDLTLFDGQGTRAEGIIETVTKKEIGVRVTSRETTQPPKIEITLIQAVCKPDRFEMILQKATELGVRTIQPIITQNTSLPAGKIQKMIGRGDAIIRNATQQCGSAWMPQLLPLKPLSEISFESDITLVGSLHPNAKPLKESFKGLENIKSAALLIGPEGDFTEKEVNVAVETGAIPVTFGTQILRTETAAIFGLSVLTYELF
ncbi:MAG: 16S rRNA (uracil(1498)-N(3))-methyltransferase [Kiritimatiellaceae bacterium]|nr:16S rRNA (uracil(1498)-N(3))-methyltransferase [Kiritimatiellaceae bacterium]